MAEGDVFTSATGRKYRVIKSKRVHKAHAPARRGSTVVTKKYATAKQALVAHRAGEWGVDVRGKKSYYWKRSPAGKKVYYSGEGKELAVRAVAAKEAPKTIREKKEDG